jgi:hypothetical protein
MTTGNEAAAVDNQVRLLVVAGLLLTSCACCGQPSISCQRSAGNEVVASVLKLCTAAGSESANNPSISLTATDRSELAKRLTIQEHPSEPEPARLTSFSRMQEPLTERNNTPGPFLDYADYQKRATSAIPTNLVSYGISGHEQVQILMPADYYSKLMPGLETDRSSELKTRVGPADIPPLVDAMPDSRYFKRIFILANDNPEDDWVSQTYKFKGFISSMSMTDGELNMYKTRRSDHLRVDVLHEWSHGLRYKYWEDNLMKCFNQAVNLERVEWNPSIYATRHEGEQWAVLGERMLGYSGESFLEACDKAPVRTALWMCALEKCLAHVPDSTKSIDHDQYVQRQRYVAEHVVPQAQRKLKTMKAEGATDFLRAQAGSILQYFESERST